MSDVFQSALKSSVNLTAVLEQAVGTQEIDDEILNILCSSEERVMELLQTAADFREKKHWNEVGTQYDALHTRVSCRIIAICTFVIQAVNDSVDDPQIKKLAEAQTKNINSQIRGKQKEKMLKWAEETTHWYNNDSAADLIQNLEAEAAEAVQQ